MRKSSSTTERGLVAFLHVSHLALPNPAETSVWMCMDWLKISFKGLFKAFTYQSLES